MSKQKLQSHRLHSSASQQLYYTSDGQRMPEGLKVLSTLDVEPHRLAGSIGHAMATFNLNC